jgi:uncharacterized membrane protein
LSNFYLMKESDIIPLIKALTLVVEMTGVGIIALGAVVSLAFSLRCFFRREGELYENFRRQFGRSILLGLEFLIAADIINTVVIEPTLQNVSTLGLVVLIRTFLSFSLDIELKRQLPWSKNK